MTTKVKPIPDGYGAVTPYISIKGASAAIDFYKKAFGANEISRMADPTGKIMHAEIKIGDGHIMLADEFPEMNFRSPQTIGGSPVILHIYVEDVDAIAKQATNAGAKVTRPVADQFYGDRTGVLTDPFGHIWSIATRKENLTHEEIMKRAQQAKKTTA